MAKLTDWINKSEGYEFCRSYGIPVEGEFVDRQEDYYIALLGTLHDVLKKFYIAKEPKQQAKIKWALLGIVKGLLLYSQKETAGAFHGVRQLNNQLYVAALYYLCDYAAVASWAMGDIRMDEYEYASGQLLSFIVTGGRAATDKEVRTNHLDVFKDIETFILNGDEALLMKVVTCYEKKYEERDFESPTDFYMTCILRCVLKKFQSENIWRTLQSVNADFEWSAYVKHSYQQHILSFLPSQQDAIDKGLLNYSGAFSLKMPTSAGKSYITELLIYHEVHSNPDARILYLAPLRALSRELRERFRRIHQQLGFTYVTKYGGSTASIVEDSLENAQLLIATPESFLSIESSSVEVLESFTLVICDEGQLLDDLSRGINYEMLLTRLRARSNVRFLFISAIIPNIDSVNHWLKGTDNHIGDSSYRPTKLVLAEALVRDNDIQLNVYDHEYNDVSYTIPSFVDKNEAQGYDLRVYTKERKKWVMKANPVGCTLALRSLSAGSVLLFATGKTTGICCTGMTKHLLGMLEKGSFDAPINYVSDLQKLNHIIEYFRYQLGENHLLCTSLRQGFAYHHGDVPQDLREKIEQAYDCGIIRLVISNTTLAEGVNLPIKTIVLAGVIDQSNKTKYLPNSRLKNIVGRVGRAGRERYGTIIAPTTYHNGMLTKLLKEALNPDDNALVKMKGTLYVLIEYLVNQNKIKDEKDINELLSVTAFADAIDEMIIRSSEGNVNEIDIDKLVSESLAYTLSDKEKKEALKRVFKARHNVLKERFENERYRLARETGLNLRELDTVEQFITDEHVELVSELCDMTDDTFVSFIIDCVLALPTVQEYISSTKTKEKLLNDANQIKRIAIMWMQGKQYHEIASVESMDVDKIVLIVMFLQGLVHDKAVSVISYVTKTKGFEEGIAAYWPEYLRLGIRERLMYDTHKLRVPERIQLQAINAFYEEIETEYTDYDSLKKSLVKNKNMIENFMRQKNYPILSTEGLMEVIDYMKKTNGNETWN